MKDVEEKEYEKLTGLELSDALIQMRDALDQNKHLNLPTEILLDDFRKVKAWLVTAITNKTNIENGALEGLSVIDPFVSRLHHLSVSRQDQPDGAASQGTFLKQSHLQSEIKAILPCLLAEPNQEDPYYRLGNDV